MSVQREGGVHGVWKTRRGSSFGNMDARGKTGKRITLNSLEHRLRQAVTLTDKYTAGYRLDENLLKRSSSRDVSRVFLIRFQKR